MSTEVTRRGFVQLFALSIASTMAFSMADQSEAFAVDPTEWKLVNTEEYTNICSYCSGGCGSLVSVRGGDLVNLEGDPEAPINTGGLCAKGATMSQLTQVIDDKTGEIIPNPNRINSPKVRRPGATDWEDISWEDVSKEIARKIKDTRDKDFIETSNGVIVNRTESIAALGGSQQNCEEEYLIQKFMRGFGVVAIDNQARV